MPTRLHFITRLIAWMWQTPRIEDRIANFSAITIVKWGEIILRVCFTTFRAFYNLKKWGFFHFNWFKIKSISYQFHGIFLVSASKLELAAAAKYEPSLIQFWMQGMWNWAKHPSQFHTCCLFPIDSMQIKHTFASVFNESMRYCSVLPRSWSSILDFKTEFLFIKSFYKLYITIRTI